MSVLTDVIASDKSSFFELIDQAVADPSTLNELQLADLADCVAHDDLLRAEAMHNDTDRDARSEQIGCVEPLA